MQNNDFNNVAQAKEFGGAVIYAVPHSLAYPSMFGFSIRISIQGNNFDIGGSVIALNNASSVIASLNQIDYTQTMAAGSLNYGSTILARRYSHLALGGNT